MEQARETGALDSIVNCLKKAFGKKLLAVLLFGSRARGDQRPDSDYDMLILLDEYMTNPVKDYFSAYRALRPFREMYMLDTTVTVISIDDFKASLTSPLILNALYEGIILYDARRVLTKAKKKLLDKLRSLGIERIKTEWGYTWRVPPISEPPFKIEVDIEDPPSHMYRLKLAREHLEQAKIALEAGAIIAAVHEAQLSIENSAKAVIAVFKPPSWVHNPAPELRELIREGRIPPEAKDRAFHLAEIAEEAAPHHALSSYGDIREMTTPYEIYNKEDAKALVQRAVEALEHAHFILSSIGVI